MHVLSILDSINQKHIDEAFFLSGLNCWLKFGGQ